MACVQASIGAASCASAEPNPIHIKRSTGHSEQFTVVRAFIGDSNGEDSRRTLMIRNIPNKYTQKVLMQTINNAGFYGKYDFFYLPIDFKNCCNVGYAFINMATSEVLAMSDQSF
jgi:hypothetical protein